MRTPPDPLDPDQPGAWATADAFKQCGNPGCECGTYIQQPTEQGDIE